MFSSGRHVRVQHPRLGDGEVPAERHRDPGGERGGHGLLLHGRRDRVGRRQVEAARGVGRARLRRTGKYSFLHLPISVVGFSISTIPGFPGRLRLLLLHRRGVHLYGDGRSLPPLRHRHRRHLRHPQLMEEDLAARLRAGEDGQVRRKCLSQNVQGWKKSLSGDIGVQIERTVRRFLLLFLRRLGRQERKREPKVTALLLLFLSSAHQRKFL